MSPETAISYLTRVRVNGERVGITCTPGAPDQVLEALRPLKPGILFLARCAEQAGCAEPLLTLVREFRHDLDDFTRGEWRDAPVIDAIQTIGAIEGWRFTATRGAA